MAKYLAILSLLLQTTTADWQYLSRPDLSPPKLNITVPSQSTEPGYIFITANSGFTDESVGPEQPAAYIFHDNGDLVWSSVGYLGGTVVDFSPTIVNGKPVLRAFQGLLDPFHGRMYGDHVILDEKYQTLQVVRAASHQLVSGHEFEVVNGRTVLVEVPVSVPFDLSPYGGVKGQDWILSHGFQELDLETGELLFEWYSLDHVSPDGSSLPLKTSGSFNAFTSTNAWDYFHLNSIEKDDEGNYLISARNYAAIFKIDGVTGDILWQLGGRFGSNFSIPDNVHFAFQHDARLRYRSPDGSIERISLFDNSASSSARNISAFSRARLIELNHTAGTASELRTYPAPDSLLANSQGNTQFLDSGNIFVNWGQAGAVTEFAENGTVLYHAYLDSEPHRNVHSYRGFRANWTGLASEDTALVALKAGDRVLLFVSWNGDTEVRYWRFNLERDGQRLLLGRTERTGFETSFNVGVGVNSGDSFWAEAIDGNGRVLGESKPVGATDGGPYAARLRELGFTDLYKERMEL
ncbi:hypothetical protein ASPWEDRAFT_108994 [Aspergillus wentii DTO 134E9]|uniref:ASST-domain-containing protein n=1 Tax=Aspergillus wentii DTO 134E9 TaxID=1073089 RepID=A0A1L9RN88_ASPWE|nr:uncharacterized protein ASPWEDRAFT_108994 [Aspergillus wentii DTO 134E9]KAI9926043.1 hypothetical protein MW887_004502 [Aspergillus wentii]OJJ36386.1 hypothetical protein ASPWEDRAFT_108994 [Aspergillus wentii DTO 134E9]